MKVWQKNLILIVLAVAIAARLEDEDLSLTAALLTQLADVSIVAEKVGEVMAVSYTHLTLPTT